MRYELLRLRRSRRFCILMSVLLTAFLCIFAIYLTDRSGGFSQRDLSVKNRSDTDIRNEYNRLMELLFQEEEPEGNYITGDWFSELMMDEELLTRKDQSASFEKNLEEQLRQMKLQEQSGMFGDEKSFQIRSLKKGMEILEKLRGVRPKEGFWGLEAVFNWRISDIAFVISAVLLTLIIVLDDKENGMESLQRQTAGYTVLLRRKYMTLLFAEMCFVLILLGGEILISSLLLGNDFLKVPVQSIPLLNTFPYSLTIRQFLFVYTAGKLLWACAVSSVTFMAASLSKDLFSFLLLESILAAISFLMGSSSSLWLRAFSLFHLSDLISCCRLTFLDLGGYPLRESLWIAWYQTALILAGIFSGKIRPVLKAQNFLSGRIRHRRGKDNTVLLYSEMKKMMIYAGGIAAVLLFSLCQYCRYASVNHTLSQSEYIYRQISMILEGEKTEEKERYIASEQQRYASIQEKMKKLQERLSEDSFSIAESELLQEMAGYPSFERAAEKYESLGDDEIYVYETGWLQLYGNAGMKEGNVNMILASLVMIAVLVRSALMETQTGMDRMISVCGKEKAVFKRIMISVILLSAMLYIPAFLPAVICAAKMGLHQFGAPACSISVFREVPAGFLLIDVMTGFELCRFLIMTCMFIVCGRAVRKTQSAAAAFGTGIILVILPELFLYLFVLK